MDNSEDAKDIAWQLINESPGNEIKVILGGGFPAFYPRPANMLKKSPEEVIFCFWRHENILILSNITIFMSDLK